MSERANIANKIGDALWEQCHYQAIMRTNMHLPRQVRLSAVDERLLERVWDKVRRPVIEAAQRPVLFEVWIRTRAQRQ